MNKSLRVCAICGLTNAKLFQCSNCRSVQYCSRDCQVADWNGHKDVCRKISLCPDALKEKFDKWLKDKKGLHPWENVPCEPNHIWTIDVKDIDNIDSSIYLQVHKDTFYNRIKSMNFVDETNDNAVTTVTSIERIFSEQHHNVVVCANLYHPYIDKCKRLIYLMPKI